jgi:hypothetical protein
MLMKISRWFFSLILLGLSSSVALADGADPKWSMGGDGGSKIILTANDSTFAGTFTQPLIKQTFTSFDFRNATGFTAGAVNLDVTDNTTLLFSIDPTIVNPYFSMFSPTGPTTLSPPDHLTLSWFGTDALHPGIVSANCTTHDFSSCIPPIPAFSDFFFEVDVRDMNPGDSFSFTGILFPIPEPSTILLVLAGGVLFPFFKRS